MKIFRYIYNRQIIILCSDEANNETNNETNNDAGSINLMFMTFITLRGDDE